MGIALGMKELTQDIASSHEDRLKRLREIKEGAKKERRSAHNLVKGFGVSRKVEGIQLRKDLAQGEAKRKSEVGKMLEEAQQSIKGFQASRKDMGMELREGLVESRRIGEAEVGELLMNAQDLMGDFHKSRKEAGSKLRKDLARGRAGLESEVKEMQGDFHKARAELRGELKKAAAAWQELASATHVKKSRVEMPPKAGAPVAEEEIPDLEVKLLAAIKKHPHGISLAEVAKDLGIVPVVLGRASRSLVEKGKIHKEGRLYFSVASG
jgi:uncharacterized protein YicC (UPF0701 family)